MNNIEKPPTILEILEEWPILLTNKYAIFWHFKKLTGLDIQDLNVAVKTQKILQLGESLSLINDNGDNHILFAV